MNEEPQDDQVIAVAFRRSFFVIALLLLVAGIIWLGNVIATKFSKSSKTIQDAAVIAPVVNGVAKSLSPPNIVFTDITAQSGISHHHFNGAEGERLLPETMGGGVAVLDFNNDQNSDLLFVSGQRWAWSNGSGVINPNTNTSSLILYQGDGAGNFTDVTRELKLEVALYGMGAAVGDYDNDGDTDIFVSAVGHNRLFRNDGDAGFVDVSNDSGIQGDSEDWSTGSAFVDYDKDGDLDLMVLNYVRWSREIDLQADYQLTGIGRAYGPPTQFAGANSYFYENDGNGVFSDISESIGVQINNDATGLAMGKGLALLPLDVDSDGWIDIVVANDMVRNFLFRNVQGQRFEEVGIEAGVAFDNTGLATGAMGIDGISFASLENADTSADSAIAIGNFGNEMTSLYVRQSNSDLFTDQAIVSGVGPASRRVVTFGLFFFDYDLDGRVDLLQANGHIENEINLVEPGQHYKQSSQLFWNCGGDCSRQFVPVEMGAQDGLAERLVGRGATYADIDKDGDQDVIITQISAAPKVLRNDQNLNHNWVQFELMNAFGSHAYGATVQVSTKKGIQTRVLEPSRSYLSQVSSVLTFGLGDQTSIESVLIKWPNGEERVLKSPALNTRHRLKAE